MDGGGDEGQQERHLVLAHKLFLLSCPDVDDLSKVALRAEVLNAVKADDMAPLFESLTAAGLLEPDATLLAVMRGRIDEETRKLDEKELSRFIAAGKLQCKIDQVAGVLETNQPDARNAYYQAAIKQRDFSLNRIQKLSRVIDL